MDRHFNQPIDPIEFSLSAQVDLLLMQAKTVRIGGTVRGFRRQLIPALPTLRPLLAAKGDWSWKILMLLMFKLACSKESIPHPN